MTERSIDLALVLPRESECEGCVDEVGRELLRLEGIEAVAADLPAGLIRVTHDEDLLSEDDVVRLARRIGTATHCEDHCPLAVHDHGPLDLGASEVASRERRLLHVTGMDCADCALKLQTALRKEDGVAQADVNFGAATVSVVIDPTRIGIDGVYRSVRRLGYDTVERKTATAVGDNGRAIVADIAETQAKAARTGRSFWLTDRRARLVLVSGALVVAGFVAGAAAPAAAPYLFAAAVVAGGSFVARAAFFSLRARQVDMNVLMSLAVIGAMAIGEWAEAGLVAFLFGLGTVLQAATLDRTGERSRA